MSQKLTNTERSYTLKQVSSTEEMIMNDKWPNEHEPALGWRIFRIEYINEDGHSNIEGQLLFPPEVDPYPLLDHIEDYFNKRLSTVEETDEMEDHPEECRCEVCRFWS